MKAFILLLLLFIFVPLKAQEYRVKLVSPIQTSDRTFQFDVVLSSDSMYLTSYQCAFKYNTAIGDSLSFSYLPNTSQLINIPNVVGIYDDPLVNRKKLAFGSNAGGEVITGEKRIGTFILSSIHPFNPVLPEISWSLNDQQYIRTILTGRNFENITNWLWFSDLNYQLPLPVELGYFTAKVIEDSVLFSWQTITELNTYGFEVVSRESLVVSSESWKTIGFVPASGNSSSPKYYNFLDQPAASGKYLYKLKIMDVDGSYKFSDQVEVSYKKKDEDKDEESSSCFLSSIIKFITKIF